MPRKIIPTGKGNFSDLSPTQVKISNVFEVGSKFQGNLKDLVSLDCESCQTCQGCEGCQTCVGCESCQKSIEMLLGQDHIINVSNGSPIKIAREVTYDLIKDRRSKNDASTLVNSKLILEMSTDDFNRLPNKEQFEEIGKSEAGFNKYLMKSKE